MISILNFITAIRKSDEYIRLIYSEGGCYQFHLLLKKIYPECIGCINSNENHVVTLYNGRFYDINGVNTGHDFRAMTTAEKKKAAKWSFANNMLIKITECPNCEEPLVV